MPIPKRFLPPNPAADELRARAEALPPEQKAEVVAALPGGGQAVSLAMPGQNGQNLVSAQSSITPPNRPYEVPSVAKHDPDKILNLLKTFFHPQSDLPSGFDNHSAVELMLRRGLIVAAHGYTIITPKGLGYLVDFGLL
jgi:hypothetical protein